MKVPKYFYFRVHAGSTSVMIEDASEADVVEVVRCRECIYGEVDDQNFPDQYLCHYSGDDWNHALHFCAYGVKIAECDYSKEETYFRSSRSLE